MVLESYLIVCTTTPGISKIRKLAKEEAIVKHQKAKEAKIEAAIAKEKVKEIAVVEVSYS